MADAHAPGKLVLCGEYAVLHGAPAIAVAVDVRARAAVVEVPGPGRLIVAGEGAFRFDWGSDGAPRWHEQPLTGAGKLLECVAAACAARGIALTAPIEISLDSRAFRHAGGEKLGLGSSAAVTVALAAALPVAAGRSALDRPALTALALHAHRLLQEGRGSGVDVAAAVHGGIVTLETTAEGPVIRPLQWPPGLHALAAWSGRPASTTALLDRFQRFAGADPARFERGVRELRGIAGEALEAWQSADAVVLLRALSDYDDALRALDDGASIGMYTATHERLARDAQAAGAAYKISGAGGGDFGVAFACSGADIAALQAKWSAEGVLTLPLGPGVGGVALV